MTAIVTTLVSFNGDDGSDPLGGLVIDAEGDLFGTTNGGGGADGTVFEIVNTSSGYASAPTTLVTFSYPGDPFGGLTADANGDLFGATAFGWGVFKIANTASGYANTPTPLVTAGGPPSGALIADANGDLFGTTSGGFDSNGTVFEIAKTASGYASTPTVLTGFNGADGESPLGGLAMDADGDLFGTTEYGGAYGFTNGPGLVGDGTVFEIAKTASGYASTPTTLVSFDGADGDIPCGSLIADANGDLFGTTYAGGADNAGTVFEIVKTATGYASTPTVLASFNGADGASPLGSLIIDANGDLFGTTSYAGAYGWGTAFEIANTASGYASAPTTLGQLQRRRRKLPFWQFGRRRRGRPLRHDERGRREQRRYGVRDHRFRLCAN